MFSGRRGCRWLASWAVSNRPHSPWSGVIVRSVLSSPSSKLGAAAMLKCATDAQIRAARGLLAWTIDDLAKRSGIQQATIRAIESGQAPGEPRVCDALART